MVQTMTAKVDAKCRVAIPRRVQEALEIGPGETLFVAYDAEHGVVHYAKAENPFDVLLVHALEEDRAGKTRSLREFAAKNGIALDAN